MNRDTIDKHIERNNAFIKQGFGELAVRRQVVALSKQMNEMLQAESARMTAEAGEKRH